MANIIFCADGTWDTEDNGDKATNVDKFYRALAVSQAQKTQYDDGVGAGGGKLTHFFGGFFGAGITKKIKDGYAYIASVYNEGDDIYLFGFSRGAYTARSIAGMITACGLPRKALDEDALNECFAAYRHRNRTQYIESLRRKYGNRDVGIRMIGVWDTVGALGIPGHIFDMLNDDIYGFLDTSLHPNVKAAYHALSIDERRPGFPATLWDGNVQSGQTLSQVWFAGVHSDVGGGYPDSGLSDITLSWMMRMAQKEGVQFNDADFRQRVSVTPDKALAAAHESWSMKWGPPVSRNVAASAGPNVAMGSSVYMRWRQMPEYRPENCRGIIENNTPAMPQEDVFSSS